MSEHVVSLTMLAVHFARKLHAVPHPLPPARAVFAIGQIVLGDREICVEFDGIGAFFVSIVAGTIIVEAAAFNNGEPREVIRARHDALEQFSALLLGGDIDRYDPLGLRGGPRAVVS